MSKSDKYPLARYAKSYKTDLMGPSSETGHLLNHFQGLRHKAHHTTPPVSKFRGIFTSPDGNLIISSHDYMTLIWDIRSGQCLHTLEGKLALYKTVEDTCILTVHGNIIKVWNLLNGQYIREFRGHEGEITTSSFIPNTRQFVTGSNDSTVRIWEYDSGKCLNIFTGYKGKVNCVCATPDSKHLIVSDDDKTVSTRDIKTNECLTKFDGFSDAVNHICLTRDGMKFVAGNHRMVKSFALLSGECLFTFKQDSKVACSCPFSITPDGQHVFIGCDITPKLLNIITGRCVRRFEGHKCTVTSWDFVQNGNKLITGGFGKEGTAKFWDIKSGKCIRILKVSEPEFFNSISVHVIPDGQHALTTSTKTWQLWNLASGKCLRASQSNPNRIANSCINHTDSTVLTTSVQYIDRFTLNSSSVKAWDMKTGRCCWKLVQTTGSFPIITRKSNLVAIGSDEGIIQIQDAHSGQRIYQLQAAGQINAMCFTPDSAILIIAYHKGMTQIWNLQTQKCLHVLPAVENFPVSSICTTPEGDAVVTGHWWKTAKLWDIKTGRCLQTFQGHKDKVTSVCVTPDGKNLITGSEDKTIRLWDIYTGRCISVYRVCPEEDPEHISRNLFGRVQSVHIMPNGRQFLTDSYGDIIKLWDISSGKDVRTYDNMYGQVNSVSVDVCGSPLVLTCSDNGLHFWDIDNDRQLGTLQDMDDAFLWATPPDEYHSNGLFWTNRKDLMTIYESSKDNNHTQVLNSGDQRFEDYFESHNRPDMVMARINDPEKYRMLCEQHSQIVSMETKQSMYELKSAVQKTTLPESSNRKLGQDT